MKWVTFRKMKALSKNLRTSFILQLPACPDALSYKPGFASLNSKSAVCSISHLSCIHPTFIVCLLCARLNSVAINVRKKNWCGHWALGLRLELTRVHREILLCRQAWEPLLYKILCVPSPLTQRWSLLWFRLLQISSSCSRTSPKWSHTVGTLVREVACP